MSNNNLIFTPSKPFVKMLLCDNNCVQYNKIKTSGNDPSITKAMRYSQLVNNYNYRNLKTHYKENFSQKTPIFTKYYSK